jgi:C4-dicarboxylate-specific signal transduction histidine kinase
MNGMAAHHQKRNRVLLASALAVALLIFAADALSPLQGAVAVLYVVVVLLVAHAGATGRAVLATGIACGLLALGAFLADHLNEPLNAAHVRLGVSLVAIAATTLLSMEQRRADAERNEVRARLEQTSAELAHAARVSTLGQLAASIAHEVNQPLSAIITYGKSGKRWLGRDVPDLREVETCLDHIVSNGSRAADVIARVRALARKGAPEAEPLALGELVDDTITLVQREARAARVVLRRSEDGPVPLALGDRVQVQQVLVNLLMNGIQAMREVHRPRRLAIALSGEEEAVRVSVRDNGTGIAGDPSNVFQPFFTTKEDGMGMGLSICRSIIEAQGGRIAAANNPDHGATISFTLPIHTHTSV